MNGNSSKQVLLSVLGIAILVVAVVGVSFAFFSYTKDGVQTNTIATGELYTYLEETAGITLSNTVPLALDNEPANAVAASTNIGRTTFKIYGSNSGSTDITYTVTIDTSGNNENSKTGLVASDIGLLVTGLSSDAAAETPHSQITYVANGQHKSVADLTNSVIATGKFEKGSVDVHHDYVVNAWVRGATVAVSDTNTSVSDVPTRFCARTTNGTPYSPLATQGNNGCELYWNNNTATQVPTTGLTTGQEYLTVYGDNTHGNFSYSFKLHVQADAPNANS